MSHQLFIEQYRLEHNPFAPEYVRPLFSSHSVRYAGLKIAQLLSGQIQTLCVSGAAGVGKTTLIEQELRNRGALDCCWIQPEVNTADKVLAQLLKDLGPAPVSGTAAELRRILQVYLTHQASNGRRSLVIVDSLDRHSAEVLRELQLLAQLKLKSKPVVQLVLSSRNDDLVADLISHHDGAPLSRAVHQRLTGFTLEETTAYVRSALEGAGCAWREELMPEECLADVQAFTRGVVGDIDALCRAALEAVAAQGRGAVAQPKVSRAILKEAAASLHLRYDETACRQDMRETLSPESVHTSRHEVLKIEAAQLLVSSGGRVVAEVSLDRPRMVMGRDGSCDISLNSNYVSRYQNLFMETSDGWMLIDLNSTNGCFVNGRRVREHHLRDGDLISLGRHELRFAGVKAAESEAKAGPKTGNAGG